MHTPQKNTGWMKNHEISQPGRVFQPRELHFTVLTRSPSVLPYKDLDIQKIEPIKRNRRIQQIAWIGRINSMYDIMLDGNVLFCSRCDCCFTTENLRWWPYFLLQGVDILSINGKDLLDFLMMSSALQEREMNSTIRVMSNGEAKLSMRTPVPGFLQQLHVRIQTYSLKWEWTWGKAFADCWESCRNFSGGSF